MKLTRLLLERYGHVSGEYLEFPDGQGLHIVLGANEAGKSTALDAVGDGLFGFPTRGRGRVNHPDDPRVGFTLRGADGFEASFTRRKTGRDKLLDESGGALPETALARFLGGTGRERFQDVFGLDGERLRKAGRAIMAEQGEAGAAILSAQTGLRGLRETVDRLDTEAKMLFGDGRGQRRISMAADAIKANRRLVAERSVSGSAYLTAHKREEELVQATAEVEAERQALRAEQARLARIRATAPIRAEVAEIVDLVADLGPAIPLPADAATRFEAAWVTCDQAARDRMREEKEIANIDDQLTGLRHDPAILAEAEAITALDRDEERIAGARRDLLGINGKADASLSAVNDHAKRLGVPDRGITLLDRMPDLVTRRAAEGLLTRHVTNTERAATATKALQAAQDEATEAGRTLADLAEPEGTEALRDAVEEIRDAGPVTADLAKAAAFRDSSMEKAESLIRHLALWSGSLQQLEATSVPLDAEAARIGEAMERAVEARQAAADAVTGNVAAVEARQSGMRRIAAGAALPTAEAVAEVRARRDTAWIRLRRGIEGEEPTIAAELPSVVEAMLREADTLADARHDELARVQEWERLRTEAAWLEDERPDLLAKLDAAREAARDAEAAWQETWRSACVTPQGPAAMREWVRDRGAMLAATTIAREAAADHGRRKEQEAALRARLAVQLPPGNGDELPALLRQGTQRLLRLDTQKAERLSALGRAAKAEKELTKAWRAHETAVQIASGWAAEWAPVADRLGLPPGAEPAIATELLATWSELDKELDRWRGFQDRQMEMRTAVDAHDAALTTLAGCLGLAVSDTLLADLVRRERAAEGVRTERARLDKGRAARVEAVAGHADAVASAEADLEALRRAAAVANNTSLREAMEAEGKRAGLLRRRMDLETSLRSLADGKTTVELAAEAAALDIDAIPGRLHAIGERMTALDAAAGDSADKLARVRQELHAMEQGQDVAGPAQAVQDALAEIEDAAQRYLRLRLAHTLLRGGIDAYRRSQQGPLLAKASLLFTELTGGRYTRLEQDEGDKGDLFIVSIRPDGSTCPAGSLSEGTTDQLFLALRLASIELDAEVAEPMPFIADDLLVNFDDERAAAALRLLAKFGQTTQVILFTHHRHLLDLLDSGAASIHRLPRELAA